MITFISVIVAAVISTDGLWDTVTILLAAFGAMLVTASGNIINDYFDVETDKIVHPDRPIVSDKIFQKSAIVFYCLTLLSGFTLAFIAGLKLFIISIFAAILLFYYSYLLKKIPFVGNVVVAFLTGLVFIYGGVAVENPSAAVIPALFAFLINLIREIIKDIQDMEGDKTAGIITLPIKSGIKLSIRFATVITVVLILLTFHPFINSYYQIEYFVVVMIIVNPVLVYVVKELIKDHNTENLNKLSNILKLDMLFGLAAIFLGR